jgi:hypothetical protein
MFIDVRMPCLPTFVLGQLGLLRVFSHPLQIDYSLSFK